MTDTAKQVVDPDKPIYTEKQYVAATNKAWNNGQDNGYIEGYDAAYSEIDRLDTEGALDALTDLARKLDMTIGLTAVDDRHTGVHTIPTNKPTLIGTIVAMCAVLDDRAGERSALRGRAAR